MWNCECSDGRIVAWVENFNNQLSSSPKESGFVQISSCCFNCAALKSNGNIVIWGSDDWNQISNTPKI